MKKVFLKIYFGNLSRTLVLFSLLPLFTYGQDIESLKLENLKEINLNFKCGHKKQENTKPFKLC